MPQLKDALSEIFSEYGNIIDLVAKKNLKAKGQAFVVFDDPKSAERAIKEIQGFELFNKPMALDFAKTKSDATVQREGNIEDFELHKRRRLAEKGLRSCVPAFQMIRVARLIDHSYAQSENKPQKPQKHTRS